MEVIKLKKLLVLVLVLCLFGMCGCTMVATDTAGNANGVNEDMFIKVMETQGGYKIDKVQPSNPEVVSAICCFTDSGSSKVFLFKCESVSAAKRVYDMNKGYHTLVSGKMQKSESISDTSYTLVSQMGDSVIVGNCGANERSSMSALISTFDVK